MAKKLLPTLVFVLALIAAAAAEEVVLQYDDGASETLFNGIATGDIEAMRLTTDHPATLLRVQLELDGGAAGGDVEVHIWDEYGGNNPDLEDDLLAPIILTVAPGQDWYEIDVSAAGIEIDPWQHFHVGIVHLQDDEPAVRLDTTISSEIRCELYVAAEDTWYYVGTDAGGYAYMIRAVVNYHDQLDAADKPFRDVTEAAGLPRTNARPAWGDYDNDGDPDLVLSGSLLYRNEGDGTFTNVTEAAGLTGLPGSGGIWADFDNDGRLDFYVSTSSPDVHYNRVMHGNDDGTFTEITESAFGGADNYNYENTEAMALGDYDLDGYVDVFAGAYERDLSSCQWDRFFYNNGDLTFTDISETIGIQETYRQCARGIQWIDFDNDGDPDIHVSNYRLDRNQMWINDGAYLTDLAADLGLAGEAVNGSYGHTIGSVWGDIDQDGDFDVIDANLAHPRFIDFSDKTMVLLNNGAPDWTFTNVFETCGVRYCETHSNPNLVDVDLDGDLDLYITSVYVGYLNHFYLNRLVEDGELQFELYTYESGLRVDNGWGSAWADYDGDGDPDLFSYGLWRNDFSAKDGAWLKVKVQGTTTNRAGLGARIAVSAGGKTYLREVQGGSGTTCQDDLVAHFGLGAAALIDRLEVAFPGGATEVLTDLQPDRTVTVVEGSTTGDDDDDDAAPGDDDDDDSLTPGGDDDTGASADDDDNDDDDNCGC